MSGDTRHLLSVAALLEDRGTRLDSIVRGCSRDVLSNGSTVNLGLTEESLGLPMHHEGYDTDGAKYVNL